MIRSLKIVCSECGRQFTAEGELHYRDNYLGKSFSDIEFICPDCIEAWHKKWQIKSASYKETDYVLTVTIELNDGSIYENMDCTPIDETKSVVTGEDIPPEAQCRLYEFYAAWDKKRKANCLKNCFFNDEFMRTTFTCETIGGEKFENIAFRFNPRGEMETERPVPDYIREQIISAYKIYENQNTLD